MAPKWQLQRTAGCASSICLLPEVHLNKRRQDHEQPSAISRRGWRYHHLGIPSLVRAETRWGSSSLRDSMCGVAGLRIQTQAFLALLRDSHSGGDHPGGAQVVAGFCR